MYGVKGLSTDFSDTTQKFSDAFRRMGEDEIIKAHLKCNKNNTCHSDVQKYVSYEKWFT